MVKIIDTSVAIKWFVAESGQETALQVFEEAMTTPQNFAVPELFYFELGHVFNRLVSKPNAGQLNVFGQVLSLGLNRFSMTEEFFAEIRSFQARGLSGYDAAYVALAKMTKGVWLTFDAKAHRLVSSLHLSRLLT